MCYLEITIDVFLQKVKLNSYFYKQAPGGLIDHAYLYILFAEIENRKD